MMSFSQFPPPMFAPANPGQGDDFDFHEVFADYFVSEFDDPYNAYTGGMANNYSHLDAIPMTIDGSTDPNAKKANAAGLPTGGIRTAFHAAAFSQPAEELQDDQPDVKKIKIESDAGANGDLASTALQESVCSSDIAGISQLSNGSTLSTSNPLQPQSNQIQLPVGVGVQTPFQIQGFNFSQMVNSSDNNASLMWSFFNKQATAGMSEQAVAERRERNREHAKRSRVRKKFILESLQLQVMELQRENGALRLLVQEHLPEEAQQIFDECCSKNILFAESNDQSFDQIMNGQLDVLRDNGRFLARSDYSLMQSLTSGQKCFLLTDPKLPDNPIVFASPGFFEMTGYTAKEVLGRNCRFLQGQGTDKRAAEVLKKAIEVGADASVCLLNYKADGTPFWNQMFVAALKDADNCIVNYVGVLVELEPESAEQSYLEDKVNLVLPLQDKTDMDQV